jgi:DNA-binding transcriptional ArsR family regulator
MCPQQFSQALDTDRKIFDVITDETNLRILKYLEKENPDVTVEELVSNLHLQEAVITERLTGMEELGLVEEGPDGFKLSGYARFVVERI